MQTKRGIPVSPGVAICQAVVMDAEDQPVPRRMVPRARIAEELKRFEAALTASRSEIEALREKSSATLGDLSRIFDFHLLVLQDKSLLEQMQRMIEAESVTAEYAVFFIMRRQVQMLRQSPDRVIRERDRDIWDLERRILHHLIGRQRQELAHLSTESILVAHDLTPSQTAALDRRYIKGIATDLGGHTSHTAILAHALGIPAVVGLEDITSNVQSGQMMIVDGTHGSALIDPDAATIMEYRRKAEQMQAFVRGLDTLADQPAVTTDGTEVTLVANIEFPDEIAGAVERGATGIGLYRTEFLFLAAGAEPSEEQQYETYCEAIRALNGRALTIRTLDLGADKLMHNMSLIDHTEANPFLGCRSIRYCLQNLPVFKTQLRAILRASATAMAPQQPPTGGGGGDSSISQSPASQDPAKVATVAKARDAEPDQSSPATDQDASNDQACGGVRIMFPLISNVLELRQARMVLNDVMEDLEEAGVAYCRDIPVGIMIEVPSAAIQASRLASEVDFFSIGTNDLIQYTVAVDRGNERVANLYSGANPAVLQLIRDVIRAGSREKIEVSLCGEMGAMPEFVMLLVGLGLRKLSITPPAVPEVKKIIRSVSINQCKRIARKVMSFDTDREVMNFLREETRKIIPEVIDGWAVS